MSKAHRKIAHFIGANRTDILFDSLLAFSEKASVSEATVVRFAQGLGYEGYSDLQRVLRDELFSDETISNPGEEAKEDPYAAIAEASSRSMRGMYKKLDPDRLSRVCDLLMTAESVLVIGYMEGFGIGAQAFHSLDSIRDNVLFSRLLFDTSEILRHINKSTAILAVSFEPHYKFTHTLLEKGKERSCEIILITDNLVNPLVPLADHVLRANVKQKKNSVLKDATAPMNLIYALTREMERKYPNIVSNRKKTTTRRYEEFL